jgi:PadR family transcriptional regulator PadR
MIQDGPGVVDSNLDGVINASEDLGRRADTYAEQLATQLRKGFLAYCVLLICGESAKYTSNIILQLRGAELVVVEGTIYPLLSRLQKDGLLAHEWQESEQGPPRKYYKTTAFGDEVVKLTTEKINELNATLKKL